MIAAFIVNSFFINSFMASFKIMKHKHIISTLFLLGKRPNCDATKIREVWLFIGL